MEELCGRTDGNVKVIFPKTIAGPKGDLTTLKQGEYVVVKVSSIMYAVIYYMETAHCLPSPESI